MTVLRVAIGPHRTESAENAVRSGGAVPADADAPADALVWLQPLDTDGLAAAISTTGARWIQLSSAGIEPVVTAGLLDPERVWTSAKGCYAEPVAEHALALALAGLRNLPERVVARSWGRQAGQTLFGERVTILGGGGITESRWRCSPHSG